MIPVMMSRKSIYGILVTKYGHAKSTPTKKSYNGGNVKSLTP